MTAAGLPSAPLALVLEGIAKVFQGVEALKGVSLTIPTGQRVALIGPNGAGKSTLLNVIHGQVTPTRGQIRLFDREITGLRVHQRAHLGIGRSFQASSIFPELSVLLNVRLSVAGVEPWRWNAVRGMDEYREAQATVRDLLEKWSLWEHRDAPAQAISYGEQRKLETLMTLASRPRLLLLDEPSAGLTVAESRSIVTHLRALDSATTVILVAHDMDLVFGVAERIVVLHNGEVIADGPAAVVAADARVRQVYMGEA